MLILYVYAHSYLYLPTINTKWLYLYGDAEKKKK